MNQRIFRSKNEGMRRRLAWIIVCAVLLVAGTITCICRWKAWFSNPAEPKWEETLRPYSFATFGQEQVPNFIYADSVWYDMKEPYTFRLLVLGDVHNDIHHERYQQLGAAYPQLDAVAQVGDWMERGYTYYAQQLVKDLEGTAIATLPVMTTPGNHEYHKGFVRYLPYLWYTMFRNPLNGPSNGLGSTYWVDFRYLRVIAIDTSAPYLLHHFTRLNKWVQDAIRGAEGRFTIVIMHHPAHSIAKGRFNAGIYAFIGHAIKKADLVFTGHDHMYARQLPFVEMGSVHRTRKVQKNARVERYEQQPVYAILTVEKDKLQMQVMALDSDTLCDEVLIEHLPKQVE